MFQWFRHMSVIARLRALALMALVAMLALSSTLLWTAYKQRLADRQTAASQRIELAHASVQWAYARQQFGKLNPTQARQHTLQVLDRLQHGPAVTHADEDLHSAMLGQSAATLGAVLMVAGLLWACIELTARDLREAGRVGDAGLDDAHEGSSHADAGSGGVGRRGGAAILPEHVLQAASGTLTRAPARGPKAYCQTSTPPTLAAWQREPIDAARDTASSDTTANAPDHDAAAQEVKRLRMAGAI